MKRSRFGFRVAVFGILASVVAVSASLMPAFGDKVEETQSRLLNDIRYLAADEREGRGIGTQGLNDAAEFIRAEFEKAGLDVERSNGNAFQPFKLVTGSKLGETNTLEFVGPDDKRIELLYGTDVQASSLGGAGTFDGEIVFCGYGIDAKGKKYNDFADIDVKGKTVIIMRRVPQQGNPKGPFSGPHGSLSRDAGLSTKISRAFQKGAKAILFVNDPYSSRNAVELAKQAVTQAEKSLAAAAVKFEDTDVSNENQLSAARKALTAAVKRLKSRRANAANTAKSDNDDLMKFGYGGNGRDKAVPIMHITQKACNQLLEASLGTTLIKLEAEIDGDLKPRSQVLKNWTVKGTTSVERVRSEVKNVIAVLEGEGPLADETIVIGAHYDHVGMGGRGSLLPGSKDVHNGADDNASGSVSLLELARRFGDRKEKLPRRLVFIAFTAEEIGLVGSARYVKEPVFPLEKTIAMFNMDMVGRMKEDKLTVFGIGTAPRWKDLVESTGKAQEFKLTLKPEGMGPSDQTSFYRKKIPVLHFFTGTHTDYHRPTDDWDKINVDGISRVVNMVEQVVIATAETKERPKYLEVKGRAQVQRTGSRPYFGSIPDFGSEAAGYPISGVAPGSPAAKAGMKGGDVIVQLGKSKIGSLDDFDLALRKFQPGDEVEVTVLRKGKKVALKITLGKPR